MSILTEPLRDFVEVDGKRYGVHTDFKVWLKFSDIISDRDMPTEQKVIESLKLCYLRGSLPNNAEGAVKAMLAFYAGEQKKPQTGEGKKSNKTPVYDFEYDAEYIFAAFLAQYGIDLTETDMHWHKFKALFLGLGEESKICKIMEYRAMDLSKVKSKEQKAFYRKMQRIYRLPDRRTAEEMEQDMICTLSDGF